MPQTTLPFANPLQPGRQRQLIQIFLLLPAAAATSAAASGCFCNRQPIRQAPVRRPAAEGQSTGKRQGHHQRKDCTVSVPFSHICRCIHPPACTAH